MGKLWALGNKLGRSLSDHMCWNSGGLAVSFLKSAGIILFVRRSMPRKLAIGRIASWHG